MLNCAEEKSDKQEKEEKRKKWDYFEIDHPKAISDKKLQQLQAKFSRRRHTEGQLSIKEENEDNEPPASSDSEAVKFDRSKSVPINLGLAESEKLRRISTDSGEESADSSRRSSRSSVYRRRSSQPPVQPQPPLLKVDVALAKVDDGFISLPQTPTDLGSNSRLKPSEPAVDDGIFTSSEETLTQSFKSDSSRPSSAASTRPSSS